MVVVGVPNADRPTSALKYLLKELSVGCEAGGDLVHSRHRCAFAILALV